MKRNIFIRIFFVLICCFVFGRGLSQTATFTKTLTVSVATKIELTDMANQPLKIGGLYRVKLSVVSTGTRTGAEYLVWYDTPLNVWKIRAVSVAGLSSNHPILEVEDNVVKVLTNHTSGYAVRAFVEFYDTNNGYVVPYLFGSSFQWQRNGANLFYMDGNVGIGTTNPQADLAVNGNVLTKEIKVKTDISVPDYVFEPDYKLNSLEYIADYIKTHRHLPEIPSAKKIQKEGLDLAEMNLLLLKKIEEMTLHMIEQQKQIKELQDKVIPNIKPQN